MATQEEIDKLYKEAQDIQSKVNTITPQVNTLTAAKTAGMDITPQTSVEQATDFISSKNIEPPPEEPPYVEKPPETPVAGEFTTPPLEMTESEKKGQTLTEELMKLNEGLIGESAYRTEQESTQDIEGKQKIVNDLTNQLTTLKNQYDQIPLQMQNQAEGRGITVGGLAPLTMAAQRRVAIDSLGVSALLQAANGNLSTAQSLVDRAVAAKYDPLREEINAKTANLNLILNSPKSTIEDKNRAQKQLDAQNNALKALDDAEAMAKEIWNIATTAATNTANFTPTAKYPTATLALQAIQKAKTKEEALQIAMETGLVGGGINDKVLSPSEAKTLGVPYGTTEQQAAKMGITPGGGEEDLPTGPAAVSWAEELIKLNPDATYEQLLSSIETNTKMSESEVQNFLTARGYKSKSELEKETEKAEEEKQFLTEDYLKNIYGSGLGKAAKDAGFGRWNQSGATEIKNFLAYLNATVKQYREAGYTDKEILKMMM